MTKSKKFLAILIPLLVLLSLSVLFAFTDLDIWQTYGNPKSNFGLTMEILGELVAPFLFVISGIIIILYNNIEHQLIKHKRLNISLGFCCSIIGLGYSIYLLLKLSTLVSIISIIITAIMFSFIVVALKKIDDDKLFNFFKIAITAIIYCISVLIIINIFKISWGRVRPREMKEVNQFTTWYLPQGINGNRSFPSGHTANATILYVLTMFVPLVKKKLSKVLLYIIPILWIIVMAMSRVIVGAHFASDVLFGATISIITFYVVKHFSLKYIKQPT